MATDERRANQHLCEHVIKESCFVRLWQLFHIDTFCQFSAFSVHMWMLVAGNKDEKKGFGEIS